jgi:hypothetical protein
MTAPDEPLDPKEVERLLANKVSRGPQQRRTVYTPEQTAARRKAMTGAQADARQALWKLYPEQGRQLYRAALAKRLKDAGFDE